MHGLVSRRRHWATPGHRRVALGAVLVLTCLTLGGASAATDTVEALMRDFGVGPLSGEPSPVALPDLAGERITLESQRGRVVMLYFWATWCPFCTREMPSTLETIHKEFRDQGLAVLAINLGEPRAAVASWVTQHGLTFPVLLDESGAVAGAYRIRGTPTVILVGRRGQFVGRTVGSREWDGEGRALITALLAARP
jgi:cytochrome c biogenesis protein CcmG, thiol:disulfide interchange protein DsbE